MKDIPKNIKLRSRRINKTIKGSIDNIVINKRLFNRVANHYDSLLVKYWMKKFNKSVLGLGFKKESRILDISCGTGELLLELQKRGMSNLYGIDISEEMLNKARKKLQASNEESQHLTLTKGDVHELPYPDSSFDDVISTEAFHHYHHQEKALSEMKRVCKQGGRIIIVDVDFGIFNPLLVKLEPGCVKVNTKQEMVNLFKEAGLRDYEQKKEFIFSFMTIARK
ncbi:class I SAM-dependent methyltransferase [Candidatus Woesearchaeota archaeon]|nr:class I SAM-dependent methyltransferase [Candidatus Woesearchaeota archaeon]